MASIMRFEFFIATRYLRAKRRQAVIGVITGISIAGVAAGVASLVVALAINNGFRQDLQNRLLGSTSHINLLRIESDGIKDWRPLMERLSKQPHVVGTAPAIYEQVLISRGPRARGAVLKGMIPAYERRVSDLLDIYAVKCGVRCSGSGTIGLCREDSGLALCDGAVAALGRAVGACDDHRRLTRGGTGGDDEIDLALALKIDRFLNDLTIVVEIFIAKLYAP